MNEFNHKDTKTQRTERKFTAFAVTFSSVFLRVFVSLWLMPSPSRAAFDDLGAGARAPGMGGAFVAVADDVYTLYYNPAGLGLLERPQLGTAYSTLYPGLKDGSNLSSSFIAYAQPLAEGRNGTLGLGWNALTLNSLYREDSLYLGYGRKLATFGEGELYGGLNLKNLRSSFGSFPEAGNAVPTGGVVGGGQADPLLSGQRSQSAIAGDVGLLYRLGKHYGVGLAVMHANSPDIAFGGGATDRLPPVVKLGFNYRSLLSNLSAQYDAQKSPAGKQDHAFTAAAERWFPKLFLGDFGLRGALSVGSREYKRLSAGASYRTRRFSADYAMALPFGGLATTLAAHRVGLSFRFGRMTEDEESLELVLEAMKQIKSGQRVELRPKDAGASDTLRRTLEELLGQARALESHAKYREAQETMGRALSLAPADKTLVERYGRLSFISSQIKEVPEYRADAMQASLHLGIMAYLAGDGITAVQKVAEAAALAPERKDVDGFLTQLEVAAGVSRTVFSSAKKPDHNAAIALTRANAALEDGDYVSAVTQSLAVLRVEPENAAAWENLGTAYFALKQYEDSLKAWKRAYDFEKSPAIRTAIRGYIKSISRAKEKQTSAPKAVAPPLPSRPSLTPQEVSSLFNRALDHYTRREFQKAKDLLEHILAADPDNVEAQKALRRIKEELP